MKRRSFLSTLGTSAAISGISTMSHAAVAADAASSAANIPAAVTIDGSAKTSRIRVRPAARGGKYLGHDAADANNLSALIALQDPRTSKIVAYGFAQAPTPQSAGPEQLMSPVSRSQPFPSDEHSVEVQLQVPVQSPSQLRLLVFGPLKHPEQARLVQTDINLLPGVDIGMGPETPEGMVIEIPGLCISNVSAQWQTSQLNCTAEITMMCGCPIHDQPGWFWPDTDFSIQLVTHMQSGAQHSYLMAYDKTKGTVSTFTGSWASQARKGDRIRQVWVYAIQPKLGNLGKFRVFPPLPTSPELPPEVREIVKSRGKKLRS